MFKKIYYSIMLYINYLFSYLFNRNKTHKFGKANNLGNKLGSEPVSELSTFYEKKYHFIPKHHLKTIKYNNRKDLYMDEYIRSGYY
jgi:hypothetical protein